MAIDEQNKIEANNILEEISEELGKCIKCGMCKAKCPVFDILREEAISARGKSIVLSKKLLDKIVFKCNLCKVCQENCVLDLKLCDSFLRAREALVLQGKGLKENEEMIKNIRETGNPFGKGDKKGDAKLYCC